MKRFFKKISLLGLLFVCVFLFLICLATVFLHSKRDSYSMEFFIKQEMLVHHRHSQKTPAIILLGGSNVAFGFNSEILRDSFNKPVINTGLHAGLGLKFLMDNTSKYLMEGDILVIAPEYHHFFGTYVYGYESSELTHLFCINPSISESFNAKQFIALIFGTKDIIRGFLVSSIATENQIYKASGFNEYGDMAAHWTAPSKSYNHASLNDFKTINTNFLDYYENAVKALRNRGVQVVIIPPSFSETSYRNVEKNLLPLFSEFEKRDLNFAIPPQESAYPDSLFFDTHYHLGYEGVVMRTNRLISVLKPAD